MTSNEKIKEAEEKFEKRASEAMKKHQIMKKSIESVHWLEEEGLKELEAQPKIAKEYDHKLYAVGLRDKYFIFLFELFEKIPILPLHKILKDTWKRFSLFNKEDVVATLRDLQQVYGNYSPVIKVPFIPLYVANYLSPFWIIYRADKSYFIDKFSFSEYPELGMK